MKMNLSSIIMFILFSASAGICQTPVLNYEQLQPDLKNPEYCGEVTADLPDFIRADCALPTDLNLFFQYFLFDCTPLLCEAGNLSVYIDNEVVVSKDIPDLHDGPNIGFVDVNQITFHEIIEDLILFARKEVCVRLELDYECILSDKKKVLYEKCIPLLSEGDPYEVIKVSNDITEIIKGDCIENTALEVCCPLDSDIGKVKKTITFSTSAQFSSSSSNTINIGLDGSFALSDKIKLNFPLSIEGSFVNKEISTYTFEVNKQISIKAEKGICKSLRPVFLLKSVTKETGVLSFCSDTTNIPSVEFLGYDLHMINLSICELRKCPKQENFFVTLKGKFTKDRNQRSASCTGDIEVSLPPDSEDFNLTYTWSGPNGFVSYEKKLENVPFGTYTLELSDECCNHYTQVYTLCDDVEYGNYSLIGGQLCRDVVCGDPGCEYQSQECVPAVVCDNSTLGENCSLDYCINGEIVFSEEETITETIEFDPFSNFCIKHIYCKDEKISTLQELPSFAMWEFDDVKNACVREIICFDQVLTDEAKLTTQEQFDNFTSLCQIDKYCNDQLAGSEMIVPYSVENWDYDDIDGCTKTIQCQVFSDPILISGEETLYDWTYDSGIGQCIASVLCDNDKGVENDHNEDPVYFGEWDYAIDGIYGLTCNRQIICSGGASTTEYGPGIWIPTKEPCPELPSSNLSILQCWGIPTDIKECTSILAEQEMNQKTSRKQNSSQVFPKVYPTHTENKVSIIKGSKSIERIQLLNTQGQIIRQLASEQQDIQLESLTVGLYFLRFTFTDGTYSSQKLIKL